MRGDAAPRQQGPPRPRAQTFPRTPVLPIPHSTGTTRAVFLVFAYGSPRPQEDSRGRRRHRHRAECALSLGLPAPAHSRKDSPKPWEPTIPLGSRQHSVRV